jgi:hypothetical protein
MPDNPQTTDESILTQALNALVKLSHWTDTMVPNPKLCADRKYANETIDRIRANKDFRQRCFNTARDRGADI